MSADLYYAPEKMGLRTIGEVDFSDGCYQFDLTVVWQDLESGTFYYADDSGCSCPSPFESDSRETVTPIGRLQDLINHLDRRKADSYYYEDGAQAEIDGACADLIRAYREARA